MIAKVVFCSEHFELPHDLKTICCIIVMRAFMSSPGFQSASLAETVSMVIFIHKPHDGKSGYDVVVTHRASNFTAA